MRWYHKVNGKFSSEDVDDIVCGAIAMNRLEGMHTSLEEAEVLRRFVAGEISDDEYRDWVLSRIGARR